MAAVCRCQGATQWRRDPNTTHSAQACLPGAPSARVNCSRSQRQCLLASPQVGLPSTAAVPQQALADSFEPAPKRTHRRACRLYDFSSNPVPYSAAWDWQHQLLQQAVDELDAAGSISQDTVILLQHQPVYTLGTASTPDNMLFDPDNCPIPVYRTERGGEVTYHGPGQLVLYPLLHLAHHKQDLHWYMRALEEVVIRALDMVTGLQGERIPGLTGVWVQGHKVAAIGVRAKRWVTYHGMAFNVCPDLRPFQAIVPCGISDRPVGSVASLQPAIAAAAAADGTDILLSDADASPNNGSLQEAVGQLVHSSSSSSSSGAEGGQGGHSSQMPQHVKSEFSAAEQQLLLEFRAAVLEAFSDVFQVELEAASSAELAALLSTQGPLQAQQHMAVL